MEQLLIARETLIAFFKRYETIILIIIKFAVGVYIFSKIHSIGHMHDDLSVMMFTVSFPLTVLLGMGFALLPVSLSGLLIAADIAVQYSGNFEIAVIVFLFLLCVLLFYARMAPKESMLILATIFAYHFKVPYLLPLIVGLYFPLTSIIPVTVGIFIHNYIPIVQGLVSTTKTAGFNITEMPDTFSDVTTTLLTNLTSSFSWLYTAFTFAMVIVIVHVVSRLAIDFAKEIAIGLGCVLNIFGCILIVLVANEPIGIPGMILLTLVCGFMAGAIRFFDVVLDYSRAESVQFEDESNYYYVRVVPKVVLSKRKRIVKRIRPDTDDSMESAGFFGFNED